MNEHRGWIIFGCLGLPTVIYGGHLLDFFRRPSRRLPKAPCPCFAAAHADFVRHHTVIHAPSFRSIPVVPDAYGDSS